MSSFAFIPRKVAKRCPTSVPNPIPLPSTSQPHASFKGKEKADGQEVTHPSAEECAILFRLALSEHSLWSDSDLRMKLTATGDDEPHYISLHYLLQHSQVLSPLRSVPQTLLVKNLRTHLSEILDFRMLVATPQPWFNRGGASSAHDTGGGYEVRLKGWDPASAPLRTKSDWDKRTIYVENVPIRYRTIPALVKYLVALLSNTDLDEPFVNSISRIQHVCLPPHHQDKPGHPPTFKGFALVTFLHQSDAQHLLQSWSWQIQTAGPSRTISESEDQGHKDALKFGFRTTTKLNWEALRAEYLVYTQQLVDEINSHQDASGTGPSGTVPASKLSPSNKEASHSRVSAKPSKQLHAKESIAPKSQDSTITSNSPYPYGCLIFVKNVHPDTNKTTLKTFFGKFLSQLSVTVNGGIDYVDYNKGMDTCYLRLSTPDCSQILASQFSTTPTIQSQGLDDTGIVESSSSSALKPINIEIVLGTREDVYWHKVPEKIRRGAVEKVLQLQGGGTHEVSALQDEDIAEDTRPKKRRKR